MKEVIYTALIIIWGCSLVVALVKVVRSQMRFRTAYQALYPGAPALPGQLHGIARVNPQPTLAWRQIMSRPVEEPELERLRQHAQRINQGTQALFMGGFIGFAVLGFILGSL